MILTWLFEIGSLPIRISTKTITYGGNVYTAAVDPNSFNGVTMRWDISGSGLIAPNDLTFDILDAGGSYSNVSDFENQFVTIRMIVDGSQSRVWKFKIKTAAYAYGKISCRCVDLLHDHLIGTWPNTPSPHDVWPSTDIPPNDDYCIPVVFDNACIPVRSVNTGTERHYILGESATYTISAVRSPLRWPSKDTWSSGSYTMAQTTDSGYSLLQPVIDDTDGDGTADDVGLFPDGAGFMDIACWYQNTSNAINNPADWFEYILEDFGVASGDIDDTNFTSAAAIFTGYSIDLNGAYWQYKDREKVISNLLAHVDGYMVCTDKVRLYQFDKESVETIASVELQSFRVERLTKMP
ncbi:MAG: hypothetical protein EOM18_16505, partial [Clostridia bacterium]|nr:hypothetical protein [Clostridia bacterium]